ncbi:hypothetical protein E1287_35595 [Actinomadura sp. KC06]|uniref:hypothetical protein n=1 Tax=Actinomadura sp. KC06 TaxID=2530369 RepID=UPI00104444FF|nr:hypothetical protein [Actinomadura sp. KC06]TDD26937.1 hypothetical protein E1287_35595 [Actinomadura sp. KC06]
MKVVRRPALSVLFGVLAAAVLIIGPPLAASAAGPRIDLQVLVVTNGSASVTAVTQQLKAEGVPYKTVDLRDSDRPVIDEAFLSDTVDGSPRAKYQGVVLPNAAPFEDGAEMAALAAYEKRFGIRQLDAHVRPSAAVGMNAPAYSGPMDGVTAQVTEAARADALRYLGGLVRFDDAEPDVGETEGFVATPLPDDPDAGKSFKPFVTATVKGKAGTVAGVYTHDGRSEMVLTFTSESEQWHFQTLGRGLVTWLTKGVHLGYDRNYFAVHVDDVFMPDARWSTEHNCTPTEDCDDGVETEDIRMEAGDVSFATQWQSQHGFVLDMAYNGAGSDEATLKNGVDPLTAAFVAVRDKFRWLNHTYSHPFLGCVQDTSTSPWQCRRNQSGQIVYVSAADIEREVTRNVQWASGRGIPVDAGELVTGEHSGLRVTPQQPDDNPNLAPALAKAGVKWTASDASREKAQRVIGSVRTVPRHPLNIFYNVGTAAEEVDQYNWIHTRRSDGGSGICEEDSSCIEPLDPDNGYESYIVPAETRIALAHTLANDPRPHYAHQSNLAEERILYPVLERVLSQYWSAFAANTPLINAPMSALGDELRRQDAWRAAVNAGAMDKGDVTAYVQDGTVTVKAPAGLEVPVTAPEGTRDAGGAPFGQTYAGERSAYRAGDVTLTLPGA